MIQILYLAEKVEMTEKLMPIQPRANNPFYQNPISDNTVSNFQFIKIYAHAINILTGLQLNKDGNIHKTEIRRSEKQTLTNIE